MRVSKPQKPQQKHWPRFDSKKSMSNNNKQNFASEKPKKKKKMTQCATQSNCI